MRNRRGRNLIDAQKCQGIASSKAAREAQSIRGAATLTDHRQVGFVERVVPYQFVFGIWQCQQASRSVADGLSRGMVSLPAGTGGFAADAEVTGHKGF
jgi:hypothetical protein